MHLIGSLKEKKKMKKLAEKKFREVIVANFLEGKKNVSSEIECNCGVISPVLI